MALPLETPQLSIVVPVLNEARTVEALFTMLAGQREVVFELAVGDGGSGDGTVEAVRSLAAAAPFPVVIVESDRGRGRQMNAGAAAARAGTLLFLHADSLFDDPLALRSALDALAAAIARKGDERVAGHFRLRFGRSDDAPSLPWYFYEWKARLHRQGCTHGDQGLLLRREFFEELGGYDESLPFLEDVRLAARIAERGKWLLLPGEIVTSARRFEVEGLRERQTLNAILMNLAQIGFEPLLGELPRLYRSQDRTGRLRLGAILSRIDALIGALPPRERLRLWRGTGRYVRSNAWQIPLFLDIWRHFRRGAPVGGENTPLLDLHDRIFDRLTDNAPGRLAAALLTWVWFRLTLEAARHASGHEPDEAGNG